MFAIGFITNYIVIDCFYSRLSLFSHTYGTILQGVQLRMHQTTGLKIFKSLYVCCRVAETCSSSYRICFATFSIFLLLAEGKLIQNCKEVKLLMNNSVFRPTASIFYRIWIEQSGVMVFILNLDKISLKKLFPTMNI